MANNMRMTNFTEGRIPKHIVVFSIPMLLGNLLQALYNTIDSIWVGRFLGPQALAAVAVSFPIIFALVALVLGLTMATTTLIAQYYGSGQTDKVKNTVMNSLLLLTAFGAVLSVVGILLRYHLLRWINVPPDVIDLAASYLGVFLVGLIPFFLYNVAGAILRGLGDSRTPLKFLAYATALNIVLDPLLIFGVGPIPRFGVAGAALATVIAVTFSAGIALRYLAVHAELLDLRRGLTGLDRTLTALTFRIGLPAGLQQVFVSLSGLAVAAVVNRFGSTVVAGFGVGQKIDQFAFMPAMTMGLAVSALVGQNLGAGKDERVRDIVKWSCLLGAGVTSIVALAALTRPEFLVSVFTQDRSVLDVGAEYLRIIALSYIAFALMFALGGVLRGAGDTMPTLVITIISLWVVRVPLAVGLSAVPGLGERGVFFAMLISPIIGMTLYYMYYRTGRWKQSAVVKPRLETD